MIKNMRCESCGRLRKRGHEKRSETVLAYSPQCKRLPLHPENRNWFKKKYREVHGGFNQKDKINE